MSIFPNATPFAGPQELVQFLFTQDGVEPQTIAWACHNRQYDVLAECIRIILRRNQTGHRSLFNAYSEDEAVKILGINTGYEPVSATYLLPIRAISSVDGHILEIARILRSSTLKTVDDFDKKLKASPVFQLSKELSRSTSSVSLRDSRQQILLKAIELILEDTHESLPSWIVPVEPERPAYIGVMGIGMGQIELLCESFLRQVIEAASAQRKPHLVLALIRHIYRHHPSVSVSSDIDLMSPDHIQRLFTGDVLRLEKWDSDDDELFPFFAQIYQHFQEKKDSTAASSSYAFEPSPALSSLQSDFVRLDPEPFSNMFVLSKVLHEMRFFSSAYCYCNPAHSSPPQNHTPQDGIEGTDASKRDGNESQQIQPPVVTSFLALSDITCVFPFKFWSKTEVCIVFLLATALDDQDALHLIQQEFPSMTIDEFIIPSASEKKAKSSSQDESSQGTLDQYSHMDSITKLGEEFPYLDHENDPNIIMSLLIDNYSYILHKHIDYEKRRDIWRYAFLYACNINSIQLMDTIVKLANLPKNRIDAWISEGVVDVEGVILAQAVSLPYIHNNTISHILNNYSVKIYTNSSHGGPNGSAEMSNAVFRITIRDVEQESILIQSLSTLLEFVRRIPIYRPQFSIQDWYPMLQSHAERGIFYPQLYDYLISTLMKEQVLIRLFSQEIMTEIIDIIYSTPVPLVQSMTKHQHEQFLHQRHATIRVFINNETIHFPNMLPLLTKPSLQVTSILDNACLYHDVETVTHLLKLGFVPFSSAYYYANQNYVFDYRNASCGRLFNVQRSDSGEILQTQSGLQYAEYLFDPNTFFSEYLPHICPSPLGEILRLLYSHGCPLINLPTPKTASDSVKSIYARRNELFNLNTIYHIDFHALRRHHYLLSQDSTRNFPWDLQSVSRGEASQSTLKKYAAILQGQQQQKRGNTSLMKPTSSFLSNSGSSQQKAEDRQSRVVVDDRLTALQGKHAEDVDEFALLATLFQSFHRGDPIAIYHLVQTTQLYMSTIHIAAQAGYSTFAHHIHTVLHTLSDEEADDKRVYYALGRPLVCNRVMAIISRYLHKFPSSLIFPITSLSVSNQSIVFDMTDSFLQSHGNIAVRKTNGLNLLHYLLGVCIDPESLDGVLYVQKMLQLFARYGIYAYHFDDPLGNTLSMFILKRKTIHESHLLRLLRILQLYGDDLTCPNALGENALMIAIAMQRSPEVIQFIAQQHKIIIYRGHPLFEKLALQHQNEGTAIAQEETTPQGSSEPEPDHGKIQHAFNSIQVKEDPFLDHPANVFNITGKSRLESNQLVYNLGKDSSVISSLLSPLPATDEDAADSNPTVDASITSIIIEKQINKEDHDIFGRTIYTFVHHPFLLDDFDFLHNKDRFHRCKDILIENDIIPSSASSNNLSQYPILKFVRLGILGILEETEDDIRSQYFRTDRESDDSTPLTVYTEQSLKDLFAI